MRAKLLFSNRHEGVGAVILRFRRITVNQCFKSKPIDFPFGFRIDGVAAFNEIHAPNRLIETSTFNLSH